MKYSKYHALGNDYIVLNPVDLGRDLDSDQIRLICHRNYGVGSDGILFGPSRSERCDFKLRIFNPDGSEAEKSGNGLRIFSRYLQDNNLVKDNAFTIETLGGPVKSQINPDNRNVTVEMGVVSFESTKIPVAGPSRDVLNESIEIEGNSLTYCAATVGNPHCVVLCDSVSAQDAQRLGPVIEIDPRFPNRTNVQFMKVLDRKNIQIEIWERGAGYTLASGSSSTAAAAVAHKLEFCNSDITVHMPGGALEIRLSQDFKATMTGEVTRVCEGTIDEEMFEGRL
ncbi:MAG: diaminopimelate epimerase [Deltaproteobacteria bacterium]|nr:diaminopimelate epimerase [Deltaproteobacteria bacterium]